MNNYFSTFEAAAKLNSTPVFSFGYLMQIFFSLAIVFGLIYISSKYLLPKLQVNQQGKIIKVVDKVVLEPQVSSYIIKAENRAWLIVVSNKNVVKIDELEEIPGA